jgi:hypothetical protein
MKELPADFSGNITLENRYHFTNLNECKYQWALVNFRRPFDMLFTGYTVMEKGVAVAPSIKPLDKGTLELKLPNDFQKYDGLVLVATDKFGKEIYKWIWKVKSNDTIVNSIMLNNDSTTSIAQTDTSIMLKGGDISLLLDARTGLLTKAINKASDNLSFTNGPVLVQGTGTLTGKKTYQEGNASVAEFTYSGNMQTTKWKMYGNGWASLEYTYALSGTYPFAGVTFSYPENYVLGAKWLGKGPYRQWKNRLQGTEVNVWQNFYNNTQTSYSPIVYPEFKGYYGDVTWMEFNTIEGKFYVASKDTGLYVRLFDFYGITGPKNYLQLPAGNISFLDCIPPIGTKLATNISMNTAALGPHSEQTKIDKPVTRTLYFYFGLPKTTDTKEQYSRPAIDNVF